MAEVRSTKGQATIASSKPIIVRSEGCTAAMKRVWPESEWSNAQMIMGRESGLQPQAVHINFDGSVDRGCFQVNSIHKAFDQTKLSDPDYNAHAALIVFHAAGWRAWTTARELW